MTSKHTKDGIARNKSYYQSAKRAQESADETKSFVRGFTASGKLLSDSEMETLAGQMRSWTMANDTAEKWWEMYEDHCIRFDFDIKSI